MQNTILCVKWGDKYGNEYVEKLKDQVEKKEMQKQLRIPAFQL